ncbi:alpha-(1,3)-fucosyltransferase 7 [Emydura macquarii macquarii]|uniref:alpha-(1,3)-fucosyltransferase 7 n=1 Tax=Emydura macquarii macquarii TaxID=1129001 RepID=UPI00352B9F59
MKQKFCQPNPPSSSAQQAQWKLQLRIRTCSLPILKVLASATIFAAILWNLHFLGYQFEVPGRALRHSKPLTVLIWHWPFHHAPNFSMDVCADLYRIKGCQLTGDHRLFSQADVVVFHHRELQLGKVSLPTERRPPGQNWVWVTLESPTNSKALAGWNQTFNWVMTYRRDSDIFMPYGELVANSSASVDIPTKTGLVSWVISNYHRTQTRVQVYRDLSRHLRVDVYGKANQKPLCRDCLLPTTSRYKFYLAFENSIHQDYITEKLWRNALLAGTVPVVLGPPRANYEKFIPADSFIHIEDFSSMKELASFLKTMNSSRYQAFFEWRKRHGVKLYTDWRERFCTICTTYPHLAQGQIYPNLESWFSAGEDEAGASRASQSRVSALAKKGDSEGDRPHRQVAGGVSEGNAPTEQDLGLGARCPDHQTQLCPGAGH